MLAIVSSSAPLRLGALRMPSGRTSSVASFANHCGTMVSRADLERRASRERELELIPKIRGSRFHPSLANSCRVEFGACVPALLPSSHSLVRLP